MWLRKRHRKNAIVKIAISFSYIKLFNILITLLKGYDFCRKTSTTDRGKQNTE